DLLVLFVPCPVDGAHGPAAEFFFDEERPDLLTDRNHASVLRGSSNLLARIHRVGRGNTGAGRYLDSGSHQALFQRTQQQDDTTRPAVEAHDADTPGLALEVAESAADFDSKFTQQHLANGQIIDAVRNLHRVELRQLMALNCSVGQSHCGEAGFQGAMVSHVSGPANFESFFE